MDAKNTKQYFRAPALLFALFITGCYDTNQELAVALLFPKSPTRTMSNDFIRANNDALTGAFLGHFPLNSDIENLKVFVNSFHGTCSDQISFSANLQEQYNFQCTIQTGRILDVKQGVIISIKLERSQIEALRAGSTDLNHGALSQRQ